MNATVQSRAQRHYSVNGVGECYTAQHWVCIDISINVKHSSKCTHRQQPRCTIKASNFIEIPPYFQYCLRISQFINNQLSTGLPCYKQANKQAINLFYISFALIIIVIIIFILNCSYNTDRGIQSNSFTFAIEIYFAPSILSGNVRAQLSILLIFILNALASSKKMLLPKLTFSVQMIIFDPFFDVFIILTVTCTFHPNVKLQFSFLASLIHGFNTENWFAIAFDNLLYWRCFICLRENAWKFN